ncbi:MAG TPA: VOC family protein [Parvibaculum sp.]|jgi:catechol 2,3-dioxygenase-like lactoylglutathione lyase family enzyme
MYDHIGLKVKDLKTSTRFYKAALAGLGHILHPGDDSYTGFGPKDGASLWLHLNDKAKGGAHIAFRAGDHAAVDRFHKDGLKAGGKDNGAPGLRTDYSPTYYAAFLIDPDGNNVEAVCL